MDRLIMHVVTTFTAPHMLLIPDKCKQKVAKCTDPPLSELLCYLVADKQSIQ